MAKVSGVDFSSSIKYRNTATIRLLNGELVELPLIKVRDSGYATVLLQRNDTIASRFFSMLGRISMKSQDLKELRDLQRDNKQNENINKESFDKIEDTFTDIGVLQKRVNELQAESSSLCDEIHEFLMPYLKDTAVINQLKEIDDKYTIEVLQLMLNGMPSEDEDKADDGEVEKQNPTIQPSQNS